MMIPKILSAIRRVLMVDAGHDIAVSARERVLQRHRVLNLMTLWTHGKSLIWITHLLLRDAQTQLQNSDNRLGI